jgi:long-subunit acyl-CoA synthetase (AMP-forming)
MRVVFQEVDEIIQSLHINYERQWEKVAKLSNTLALIPQVIHGVQEVCDSICKFSFNTYEWLVCSFHLTFCGAVNFDLRGGLLLGLFE